MSPQVKTKSVIQLVLIHGTFSRNAEWMKAGSSFRQSLDAALAGTVHEIHIFQWSGWNSHGARMRAANRLKDCLATLARARPEAARIVIGHSHGGTIAIYSMNESSSASVVSGLVCLSTPFFRVKVRKIRRIKEALDDAGLATGIGLFALAIGLSTVIGIPILDLFSSAQVSGAEGADSSSFWSNYASYWLRSMQAKGIGIVMIFFLGFAAFGALGRISSLLDWLRKRGAAFAAEADSSQGVRVPLLCFHQARDEAIGWLRLVGEVGDRLKQMVAPSSYGYAWFVCLVISVLALYQTSIADYTIEAISQSTAGVYGTLPSWIQAFLNFFLYPDSWYLRLAVFWAYVYIGSAISGLAVATLVAVSQSIGAILGRLVVGGFYAFGSLAPWNISRHWLTSIEALPFPSSGGRGSPPASVIDLTTLSKGDCPRTWLRHSRVHQSPEVARAIGAWIGTLVKEVE